MTINLQMPDITELKPKITVFGVGGAGGNAVNNMITAGLEGCEFVVANTDAQALTMSKSERKIQMGIAVTEGLGAGSQPEVGRAAAEEVIDEIRDHLDGSHMVFITAGMGGGTGTGAAPVIAKAARDMGILTVGVVTKPFQFEGARRMRIAEGGIDGLQESVDTLIVIPNQNLFRIANEKTTFADAFGMADEVLYSGVACITDLMVKEGLINLDFADVRSVMRTMGKAMMGTGEASGDGRASQAAEAAIANPLLDETSMHGAKGLLISITGGTDLTLFEVDEAATRIREEVDADANIILGATFDQSLEGIIRVSVVATGVDKESDANAETTERRLADLAERLRTPAPEAATPAAPAAPSFQPRPLPKAPAPQAEAPVAEEAKPMEPVTSEADAADLVSAIESELAIEEPVVERAPIFTKVDPEVAIEPLSGGGTLYAEPEGPSEVEQQPVAQTPEPAHQEPYVPPMPEMPETQAAPVTPRMPTIEDFPPIAQRQVEAEGLMEHGEDRRPMSLLRRLASGLGKREGDEDVPHQHEPRAEMPAMPAAPVQEPAPRRVPHPAPRQAPAQAAGQGDLDIHGRQQPRQAGMEDDQLEIPAFLRRQAQ